MSLIMGLDHIRAVIPLIEVEQLSLYQFRVGEILDLYPTRRRYHNIVTQERGEYLVDSIVEFAKKQIDSAQAKKQIKSERNVDAAVWWSEFSLAQRKTGEKK